MRCVTRQYHLKQHLLKQGPKVLQPVIGGMTESDLLCDCEVVDELGSGYTRDWLPAYSFVLRERAMVLTGERTLSDTSGARQ